MTIIERIRKYHSGAWWGLFHVSEDGFTYLPTGESVTNEEYAGIRRAFTAKVEPSAAQRKVNALRYRAENNHG